MSTLALVCAGERAADAGERYLLIENPGKLVIYDQYQRILSPKEVLGLGTNVPMRILNSSTLFGDGVTACVKAGFQADIYYLLLESDGRLAGETGAGRILRLEATPLNDTVDVLRGDHLLFESSGTSRSRSLPAGERLIRIFQYGSRAYVMRLRTPATFGWVAFDRGGNRRTWEIVSSPQSRGPAITARTGDNVRARVRHANAILLGLYTYFNRSTRSQLQQPQWTVESGIESVVCTLRCTGTPDRFAESTRALAKDLESAILGSGLAVVSEPGKVVIRPK